MRTIKECRSCQSDNLTEMLNLGKQYLSDFRADDSKPPQYPLVAVICEDCMLVQLKYTAPSKEMYHENYGFKSGISDSIKRDLQDVVINARKFIREPRKWLDIASNDGTLLSYVPKRIHRTGVDPVDFLCKEAEQYADTIVNDFFSAKVVEGEFDVITSISCFYDMDDPNKFVGDVAQVLHDRGIWVIQQNYLLPTMELGAVDNFCHEHLEYYTMLSLENLLDQHDLEIIEVSTSMVNGGSLRTIVAHRDAWPVDSSVEAQRAIERDAKLETLEPYTLFAKRALEGLSELKRLVDDVNATNKTIYIVAASTRGSTIWQGAGLTAEDIPYAIERNPVKVGHYFSALGMPIVSEEFAREHRPDYLLIGPWFFAKEILEREKDMLAKGTKAIVPLPKLEVLAYDEIFRAENE